MIRRPVPWPNGAKVAVAITFDMDADSLVHVEHPRDSITRVSTISMLRYGPEVAVPRILEGYRRFDLKQTFFVPAWCIEHYPEAVEAMVRDGQEVGFHGYIHEAPNRLSREEERYWMRRSIEVIEQRTGQRPRGNRSPLYNFSIHTAELLAEEGFLYDSSLMGDDVPYLLATPKGEVVELPVSWATDDWPPYVHSIDLDYMFQILPPDVRGADRRVSRNPDWARGVGEVRSGLATATKRPTASTRRRARAPSAAAARQHSPWRDLFVFRARTRPDIEIWVGIAASSS
jgi:peptidoglycan/xylan/chitin deacetylase (PgdA/CDA1 family)